MANLVNPSSTTIEASSRLPPDLKALSLSVNFTGWRFANDKFKSWATEMAALHKPIWIKAGIFKAVMASTNKINKDTDLVLSVAEKWCPMTNTFVFPWGEVTVTLEDVMLLLGFSVLGCPVFAALDSEGDKIKAKLETEWYKIANDNKFSVVNQVVWIKRFMGCGDELEHVAFLVLWLSYFVFPSHYYKIYIDVFSIAVHLSRGTRIALAPAVLAHLYADLSILKAHITTFAISKDIKKCDVRGLFKLVQVWTWERFRELQPVTNELVKGEPRLALWHNLHRRLDNSRLDSFEWRPYTKTVENWEFPKFYPERAMFVPVDINLDDEFVSFARCFKMSELVGNGCVEHYFPNRVALQFGMHQDALGPVKRNKLSQEEAWNDYNKPIDDLTLYIPSRSAVPCDYPMFSDWWRKCSSEENLVVESDETSRQRNITSVVPSSSKISRTSTDGIKNSGGDSFEPLVERSRLVVDINDCGPRQKLDSIRDDGDETIQPPQEEQRTDENNSSEPSLGEANDIAVSPPATIQNSEDEFDVLGSNAEKMTIIDDGAVIAGEKASSGEKEDDSVYDDKVIADGYKEPECLLPEDGVIAGEILSSGEKEDDAVDDDSLIQQKLAYKNMESNIHIHVGGETQGQDCSHHDNTLGTEEARKPNGHLEDLEMRNEDVVGGDASSDSYKTPLKRVRTS